MANDNTPPENTNPNPNVNEETVSSYTEDNFIEDCIELVHEELLKSGVNQLPIEDSFSNSVLESIKGCASRISHDLIDAVDAQLQQLNALKYLPEKLHELIPNLRTINQSEESLFSNGTDIVMAYLHQKTDELFDTSLAQLYTEEAKALSEEFGGRTALLEVPLPPAGNAVGSGNNKNILKNFTKNNYRKNLQQTNPHPDYGLVDAHHVFPQKKNLQDRFNYHGININDPQYLVWWGKNSHRPNAIEYNKRWERFFNETSNINQEKILEFGKKLMAEYGIEVLY